MVIAVSWQEALTWRSFFVFLFFKEVIICLQHLEKYLTSFSLRPLPPITFSWGLIVAFRNHLFIGRLTVI